MCGKSYKKLLLRMICLLTLASFLVSILSACEERTDGPDDEKMSSSQSEEDLPTLHLCFDMLDELVGSEVSEFISRLPKMQNVNISYEVLPKNDPERAGTLTRIRTEILAGEGPDLFICVCPRTYDDPQSLFLFPENSMDNGIFLSLDSYIQTASNMGWENLSDVIMDAGKNEKGQLLLPLSYTFKVLMMEKSQSSYDKNITMNWDDMVNSDDATIQLASGGSIYDGFADLADYKKDILLFAENDLLSHAEKELEINEKLTQDVMEPLHILGLTYLHAPKEGLGDVLLSEGNTDLMMIPKYNTEGGISARVTSFAGINRNTDYPEEAFNVLDILLSKQTQQNCPLYGLFFGVPTQNGLCQLSEPAMGYLEKWTMSDDNFAQFESLREKINSVAFSSTMDIEIDNIIFEYLQSSGSQEDLEKIVHKTYMTMQMMLAES